MSKEVLRVENLSVCFEENCVVDRVSFCVEKGDYLMILGPNGAGKSVLMKSLIGVLPKRGIVKFFGKDIDQVRCKIGYVPQYVAVDRNIPLTVSEVVSLGFFGSVRHDEIDKLLKMVGMNGAGSKLFGTLSGGQTKRVLIARALAARPRVVLLDEPFAGIDVVGEKSVVQLLDDLRKKMNLTVVIISHDFSLVYKSATKVLCINKQRICFGSPAKINQKTIEKTFGKDLNFHVH